MHGSAAAQAMEQVPLSRRIVAFVFLLVAYFCYAWAWNTVDVLRPYLRDALGLTNTQAGFLYSVQAAGALVGAVVNGQIADRFGRRRTLMAVMIGFGIALLAGLAVTTYLQALLQRFLLGYFTGAMFPITVGLYVGMFAADVRGRLAGFVMATYNAAVAALGAAAAWALDIDWRLLLTIGAVPILLACFAPWCVPDDRKVVPYGGAPYTTAKTALPILELFAPAVRRQTLLLALLMGLNFFAYQAFAGWVTTYLKDIRQFSGADVGLIISWQFWGSCLGGFAWGWFSDRFGRRTNAIGFFVAALIIVLYLKLPLTAGLLMLTGFAFGFMVTASVIWGPWMTELYPAHLRSTAASIFNWGRVMSFFAPLITGAVASQFGLVTGMLMASACFILAGLIWLLLPETIDRRL